MGIKLSERGKTNAFVIAVPLLFVGFILVCVYLYRSISAVTMPQQIVSPRPGIECFIVSGADGVGVDCYPTAGLPPRI